MAQFSPIKHVRLREKITDQLKQAILLGRFKPGAKLPDERDLAEQFQVSRLSIRETMRALKADGFIEIRLGATGGAYVTELSFQHLADAFMDLFLAGKISVPELHDVRLLIDPEIARLAALRITPEYACRLEKAYKGEDLPVKSREEQLEKYVAVHVLLAEMCGNRFLEAIVRSVMNMTRQFLLTLTPFLGDLHKGLHRPIVDAVIAGDSETACSAMRSHTIELREALIRIERLYNESKIGQT